MMRGLPVLFVLAAGCDSPFGDSPLGIAVTDAEVEAELECAALLYSWCRDADGDGHGTKEGIHPPMAACELLREAIAAGEGVICLPNEEECTNVDRYVNSCDDCDDNSADVYQSTPECDSSRDEIDNDCDGLIDEDHDVTTSYYADADGDTYGDPNSMKEVSSCEDAPDEGEYKYVVDNSDCDDSDSAINPGQVNEGPCGDGIDQNCDGDPGDCALFQEVNVSELEPKPKSFSGATAAVALGNVDKDEAGLADFAVGFADSTMVQIFYGGFEDPAITISDSSTFGIALTVGYFDSDALPDLAVGGPSPAPGMVSVRLGASGYTEASAIFTRESESVSELGLAVQSLGSAMVGKVAFSYKVKDDNDNLSTTVWIPSDVLVGSSQCLSSVDVCLSGFKTDTDWPLALASATFDTVTYVGVGFSGGTGLTGPGLALYQINSTTAALTLTDKADSASALGASVAFGTLSDEKETEKETSLVLVGAPGTGSVYMLEGRLSGTLSVDVDQDVYYKPVWTSTAANNAGSSVAFIGDIDLDGDEELAIGGDGVLWIIAQGESGFLGGNLDSTDQPIASGKITGFKGIIRHIVNAGDVDGDGYSDLLISTDSTTYLLYGGYKPAQEDASDTGN